MKSTCVVSPADIMHTPPSRTTASEIDGAPGGWQVVGGMLFKNFT